MKVIVAGSRNISSYELVKDAIENSGFDADTVVSGCAQGVDKLGEQWAKNNNKKVQRFPANWEKYGKQAGFLRNVQMAENADALVAVWDGKSSGTKHMIETATAHNLKVHIKIA